MAQQDILKKVDFEEAETEWSIKRIAIGVFVLFFAAFVLYVYSYDSLESVYKKIQNENSSRVQGASTQERQKINYSPQEIKQNVYKNVDELKNQVNNLNAADIASSSPQVQKILKDLQDLKDYPKNQAKEACMNICSNF